MRSFLCMALVGVVAGTVWTDVRELGIRGRAFPVDVLDHWADRLPGAAESVVRPPVWQLSRDTAGMYTDFETDTGGLVLNTTYFYEPATQYHFPLSGMNGMDLYEWDVTTSLWRWVATTTNYTSQNPVQKLELGPSSPSSMRKFRLHFPTYNGVEELFVGVDDGAILQPAEVLYKNPPIVWYGTSICQGGVASRPGFAFTNNIMRNIGREIYNFGFSGNCLMEIDVVQYLVKIQPTPELFIVDCEWNMSPEQVTDRTVPLVKFIRENLPKTPIVLVESTNSGDAWVNSAASAKQTDLRQNLKTQFNALITTHNITDLHYVTGPALYQAAGGPVTNPTVAGVHPSDLGMKSVTDFYTTYLPTILPEKVIKNNVVVDLKKKGNTRRGSEMTSASHGKLMREIFDEPEGDVGRGVVWQTVPVMGRVFNRTERYYNRLPMVAKTTVRPEVYAQSLMSAGMSLHFVTNSSSVALNFSLVNPVAPLWNMPNTGVSGFDLYRYDTGLNTFRNVKCVHGWNNGGGSTVVTLEDNMPTNENSRFILYLPLGNEVLNIEVGVNPGSFFSHDENFNTRNSVVAYGRKPIVWYGGSTTQGNAASRPGNIYANILSRNLRRMVLNFGISGEMDTSDAAFLSEVDAALIVVDCLADMTPEMITENTASLVKSFRQNGHPTTPILLVSGTVSGDYWLNPEPNQSKRSALQTEFEKLSPTDPYLHLFLNAQNELFAQDWLVNPTVGGTHPTDLGHREMAEFYTGFLKQFLE